MSLTESVCVCSCESEGQKKTDIKEVDRDYIMWEKGRGKGS